MILKDSSIEFFQNKQRQLPMEYNLNSIFSLLTFNRFLFPSSKKNAYEKETHEGQDLTSQETLGIPEELSGFFQGALLRLSVRIEIKPFLVRHFHCRSLCDRDPPRTAVPFNKVKRSAILMNDLFRICEGAVAGLHPGIQFSLFQPVKCSSIDFFDGLKLPL
ncbi:hypothetical protein FMM80_06790 [Schaedlerella arabinosiphila]|uniref:Uncharacterized protein n=1 Tax=Schaedlerella arabinosiphila TaxID=2044587 RepID=A0A9X5H6P4_9FIRM|nr:hypothetical protein [Schaedlerella arabinosiphila]